jgi:hypothetical protein
MPVLATSLFERYLDRYAPSLLGYDVPQAAAKIGGLHGER